MTQPTDRLRPEALPPVRSAKPIFLALATALLTGAIGGFVMHSALPGEDPATPPPMEVRCRHQTVIPIQSYGGETYFHLVPAEPPKSGEPAGPPKPFDPTLPAVPPARLPRPL